VKCLAGDCEHTRRYLKYSLYVNNYKHGKIVKFEVISDKYYVEYVLVKIMQLIINENSY
jgi:hypothetical protein